GGWCICGSCGVRWSRCGQRRRTGSRGRIVWWSDVLGSSTWASGNSNKGAAATNGTGIEVDSVGPVGSARRVNERLAIEGSDGAVGTILPDDGNVSLGESVGKSSVAKGDRGA